LYQVYSITNEAISPIPFCCSIWGTMFDFYLRIWW